MRKCGFILPRSIGVKRVLSVLFVLALVFPSVAAADPIHMDWRGTGSGMTVSVAGVGDVFAGELRWTLDGSLDILSYCVDIASYLGDPQMADLDSISNLTGASSNTGGKVAWLYNTYSGAAHGSDFLAAALQVAIWEVIGGNAFSLSGASALTVGVAAHIFVSSLPGSNYGDAAWLNVASGARGQDQVTHSVPEPGTLLLLGAGAVGLAARRRFHVAR